ncbi:IclR family transcriptional regulator [Deltaproteobacteria bacterium Smac51]|nr:IclR family transcriptional regulator [Deltaproteobacteria bacterium Smac51]
MAESRLIESVARALDIMEVLDVDGELGITEIARKLGMEKSTVYRAINTLRARHYVSQDPDTLKYSNSYKLFEMGHNVARNTGLPKMAYRFMRHLATTAKGAVNLGVRDGKKVVYIDKIESDETVKVCMKIGQGIPLYCTGLGKSLLAYMPEREVRALLGKETFERFTATTHTDIDSLLADLADIRKRGYSIDDEEHIMGILCVAAPAFNAKGETIAAISLATPKMAHSDPAQTEQLGQAVYEAAEGFTQSLGGRRPVYF